ncbi:hypothetical protein PV755_00135 [Streptomyces caniscabiei]|uniref:hypothetical protein n=1 Tax=Streptomyces caniscabiei TaxID=2746961 RepID=UPI0029B2EDC9|nr:hypothetical protein [Streptomyces caniscabiei]MDX3507342.1 hypothetical protein [Streptomyces caniscabiei]
MTADEKGVATADTPGGEELRERLRTVLGRLIDPADDTIPTLDPGGNGFVWVPAESVIDDLMKVVGPLQRMYLEAMASLGRAIDKELT